MFRLVIVILTLAYSAAVGVNIKAYFPPSNNTNFPRLRLDETLPNLRELTFCSWVKVHKVNESHEDTILSYSTVRDHNEFLLYLFYQDGNINIKVQRGTSEFNAECTVHCQVRYWCHVCVSWSGTNGSTKTYIDGKQCKEEVLHFNEPYVPAGGILVIGQEQDGLDTYYDINQGMIGDITDYHLWNEMLSEEQVQEVGSCEGKRKEGNVISWLKTPVTVLDGVTLSETQLCLD